MKTCVSKTVIVICALVLPSQVWAEEAPTFTATNNTTTTVPGAGTPPADQPPATTPTSTPAGSKRLPIRVARSQVANKDNAAAVLRYREALRVQRESLQRLGENGLITATEMAELGEKLREVEQDVERLARSQSKISEQDRKKMKVALDSLHKSRINRQFNSVVDGSMTEDRLKTMHGNLVSNFREDSRQVENFEDFDAEERREIQDIRRDIDALVKSSKEDGTFDSPKVRQELARLRYQFNRTVNQAQRRVEREEDLAELEAEREERGSVQARRNRAPASPLINRRSNR